MATAVATYYKLKIGDMWLAPRASIAIEESSDFEQLASTDQQCGGCSSLTSERTFTFKIHFLGHGSLKSAWAMYNRLLTELSAACDGTLVLLTRQVQDEDPLIYAVQPRSTARMVDVINQYTCERILTIELKLALKATDSLSNGLVITTNPITGASIYTVTPPAIPMNLGFPNGTVGLTTGVVPSALALTLGFPTPSILTGVAGVDPVALVASVQTFVRDLGGVDAATPAGGFVYRPAKEKILNGSLDFDTHDLRAMLVMTNTTADTQTTATFISSFSTLDEFNGAGYARVALAGKAVNQDAPGNRAEFDANDTAWAALSNGTRQIQACVIFKFVTNDADSIPIMFMPYTNFNPAGGVLTNEWGADGLLWLT